jgi:hypothetical protein
VGLLAACETATVPSDPSPQLSPGATGILAVLLGTTAGLLAVVGLLPWPWFLLVVVLVGWGVAYRFGQTQAVHSLDWIMDGRGRLQAMSTWRKAGVLAATFIVAVVVVSRG